MYEQIFRGVLFPLYEGVIRRRHTDAYLREYEKSQWLDGAALENLRLRKLNALLSHCWDNVPFLQRYWREAGLERQPLRHTSDLASYPTITKQVIADNFSDMRASDIEGAILEKTTGGSTGDPFKFEYTMESYARRTAVMWRGYRWCGSDLGRRTAYVWGTGVPAPGLAGLKERCYHFAFNRLILNAFTMTESNLGEYAAALARFQPRVVVGYVAPLVLLARWMLENGVRVPPPDAVISGAEALTRPDREAIGNAFNAPVFNTYGCREFMLLACECEQRDGLHVSADHLVLETVDDAGSLVQGESGDVCVTDLHNYAMPFVRYLNGDRATMGARACSCGRSLPLLESIDGRILDVILSPDGRAVPGEFFVYVMLYFPDIRQYQVVQNSLDDLEVRIVPRAEFPASERERLTSKIAERIGTEVRIRIREMQEIPLTASGKRRVTVSNIQ